MVSHRLRGSRDRCEPVTPCKVSLPSQYPSHLTLPRVVSVRGKKPSVGTIAQLLVSIKDTETSISETQDSLKVNRESQAEDTNTRNEQNAQFTKNLKNLQDAERILAASIKVIRKKRNFSLSKK